MGKLKFQCPDCLLLYVKWKHCKAHLKESGHAPFSELESSTACEPFIFRPLSQDYVELKPKTNSEPKLKSKGRDKPNLELPTKPSPTSKVRDKPEIKLVFPKKSAPSLDASNTATTKISKSALKNSKSDKGAKIVIARNVKGKENASVHSSRSYPAGKSSSSNSDSKIEDIKSKIRNLAVEYVEKESSTRSESELEAEELVIPILATRYSTLVEKFPSLSNSDIIVGSGGTGSDYTHLTPYQQHLNFDSNSMSLSYGNTLADDKHKNEFQESAYLGKTIDGSHPIYLNVHEPFCVISVGIQGAGKSHTMSVILESCLISTRSEREENDKELLNLTEPMCALVLHYDQNVGSICEATGLISPRTWPTGVNPICLPKDKMTVLVSPSFYLHRKAFYGDYCNVRPLLFKWKNLTADHIKKLMRISEKENQLYMATLLEILRSYQRRAVIPDFQSFLKEVGEKANVKSQEAPLMQRLSLLESFIVESEKNAHIREYATDLNELIDGGNLIVADLTDPLLSKDEANGVFQLLVEQFRTISAPCSKLLALDEAHKFMDGDKSDGLSQAILNCVRLMRHDGMRVAISSQSPRAILPEILELVSMTVLHKFHSRDWFHYLESKIAINQDDFEKCLELDPGSAVVFCTRHLIRDCEKSFGVSIRPRLTSDRGCSVLNKSLINL